MVLIYWASIVVIFKNSFCGIVSQNIRKLLLIWIILWNFLPSYTIWRRIHILYIEQTWFSKV